VEHFGHVLALTHAEQPQELAPAYVFLGAPDSSFVTGGIVEVTGDKPASR